MRAATDPDFGLALAFVVLIKANSVSSVIKQYSIRDFKNRYHIGSDKIRTAIKIGLKEKLLRSFTLKDKHGKPIKYLRALRIHKKKGWHSRLSICDSPSGKQIYLESKVKKNYDKYSQLTTPLSLSNVQDLFIIIMLDKLNKGYWKGRDLALRRKLEQSGSANLLKQCKDFEQMRSFESKACNSSSVNNYEWVNTGYSYRKMSESCGKYVSLYKVARLMHKAVEDGLFSIIENRICVREGSSRHRHWNDNLGVPLPNPRSSRWAIEMFEYPAKQEQAIKDNQHLFCDQVYKNPVTGELENLDARCYWGAKRKKKIVRQDKLLREKNADGVYMPVPDPKSRDGYVHTCSYRTTYTNEDRYKKFKRMANSYERLGDFNGKVLVKSHYYKKKEK